MGRRTIIYYCLVFFKINVIKLTSKMFLTSKVIFHSLTIVLILAPDLSIAKLPEGEKEYFQKKSNQQEDRSLNHRTSDRPLAVYPLLLVLLAVIASFIWITMVAVLPGAWTILGRAFPSVVPYLPMIVDELESLIS